MKIAIIGSSSLLASYFIESVKSDESIQLTLFGRTPADYTGYKAKVDFKQFDYPTKGVDLTLLLTSDVILYCAAAGVQANALQDVNQTYEINAFLPIRILNYLADNGFKGKWISFGSYFEIGDNNEKCSFSEHEIISSNLSIPNHYCVAKRLLTRFFSCNLSSSNTWHFILPTIYGAKENAQRLIPYVVGALRQREIPLLSAGEQVRQYIHCLDVVALLQHVINTDVTPGIYNVTPSDTLRIADLVGLLFNSFRQDPTLALGKRTSRDEGMKVLQLNTNKIEQAISGWRPTISLADGVQEYF